MTDVRYKKILSLSKKTALLHSVNMLLDWDQETYMPSGAIAFRSEQAEMMASLVHKSRTSPAFAKALSALIDLESGHIKEPHLTSPQKAALKQWRRDYTHAVKLPNAFVKKFAKTISTASHIWQSAKRDNNFKQFAPHLEKIVELSKKKADILGYQDHPYDALLDLYEPDLKTAFLTPLFTKLKEALTGLIKEIKLKPPIEDSFLYQNFPKDQQLTFSHLLLRHMGFDSATSRLDIAAHPFCNGIHPTDTRMTTSIHPKDIMFNIGAVLHEGGHGLYNKGLSLESYPSPLAEQISLGIDESQSRWWETLIGQSKPFWQYFFPFLQKEFPEQLGPISFEAFYPAINAVKPGLIRIEADEVSYNLHVVIRFEIEKGLIDGSIKVKEIPEIWNDKMKEYLRIVPPSDSQGCLQDIHWSLGFIGYFPTYTLGNLYSVQFFQQFEKDHLHWKEELSKGSLNFIREWLRENIHQYGRQYTSEELSKKITGQTLSEGPYVDYLTEKYKRLYHLK